MTVSGTTAGASDGASTFRPSIALKHRDRRRDGAVAVEQRRTDEADHQKLRTPRSRLGIAGVKQRQQCDDAAFAAVVGAQDQERVFERNDQDQRPQDQRDDAEDRLGRDRSAVCGRSGRFLQRVEGTGTDVAVDDAKRADRRRQWERAGAW